jgi:hypothetical protein
MYVCVHMYIHSLRNFLVGLLPWSLCSWRRKMKGINQKVTRVLFLKLNRNRHNFNLSIERPLFLFYLKLKLGQPLLPLISLTHFETVSSVSAASARFCIWLDASLQVHLSYLRMSMDIDNFYKSCSSIHKSFSAIMVANGPSIHIKAAQPVSLWKRKSQKWCVQMKGKVYPRFASCLVLFFSCLS